MALVMSAVIQDAPYLSPTVHTHVVYATMFGADLGPNLTIVGSLATMLWLLILRRKGLEISALDYLKVGLLVVPPMLIGGILLLAW